MNRQVEKQTGKHVDTTKNLTARQADTSTAG